MTVYAIYKNSDGTVDLSALRVGTNATFDNFSNSENNLTAGIIGRADHGAGVTTCLIINPDVVDEAAGADADINQTIPTFGPGYADSFTFYTGSDSQLPDSIIESFEGRIRRSPRMARPRNLRDRELQSIEVGASARVLRGSRAGGSFEDDCAGNRRLHGADRASVDALGYERVNEFLSSDESPRTE